MTTTELKEPPTPATTQNEDSSTSKSVNLKKVSRVENNVQQDRDKESFYKDLQNFHENRNTPITRFPKINGKEVDLHKLYSEVISRGGWLKVNIRNEWEDMISVLGFSQKCVNASVAIKQIYARFLDKYEKLNFLGEDPDRNDEIDDDGRHKKWSTKNCMQTIPMTYNYNQHNVTEQTRIQHKLSTDLYKSSEYEKLLLSLMSPLPNEQDFAINVCTLMANESKHTLKIENCPKLLDCLLGHAGVYCHLTMRNLFEDFYINIRRHSLQSFWNDTLQNNTQILELSYDDCFQSSEEPKNIEEIRRRRLNGPKQQQKQSIEDSDNDLFASDDTIIDFNKLDFLGLGRRLGTHEYIGQRIQQIASIIRNLSFFEENILVLAKNRTFIRFLVMCSNIRWGNIHHMALDVCGNIATEIQLLDPSTDELTRCLLATICDGLEGQDRGVIITSLEILNKLSQKDTHNDYLHKCLDQKIYNQICLYLSLNDIMLLLYTLECIYSLSSLGPRSCNSLIQVRGIIDTLISLITVEAQSYGPDGCILMRVVETVPGNMLPMVAKNIANLQNVAMHGQVNMQQLQQQQHQQIQNQGTINQQTQSPAIRLPAPQTGTTPQTTTAAVIVPTIQTTNQPNIQQNKSIQSLQENEQFAISWLTATFEMAPSAASRVEQQELYKMYLSAIKKTGRCGSVTQSHFPRIVRSIFGTNIGPTMLKVIDTNGVESNGFFYICVRVRANPLPLKGSITVQQPPVIVKTPIKTQPQQQQQLSKQQQQNISSELVNKQIGKSEVGSKQQQQTKIINTKQIIPTTVSSFQSKLSTSSVIVSQGQQQQQQNDQNKIQIQEIVSNPINTIPINNNNNNNIQSNRPQQLQQNIILPNNNSNNNSVALTSGALTKTPVIKNVVVNKNIILQHQQQQKGSNIIVTQQGQISGQAGVKTSIVQTSIAATATTGSISGQIGIGGQQNPTSLIKSLLANKVTTTSIANSNITTNTTTETIIASAASNNQSGLISQNVNIQQLAQRQNLAKQKEISAQQQQMIQIHQQQQQQQQVVSTPIKLATTTISALVNNPIIQTTPVKVGQTTIKPINPNTIDKKTTITTSILPSESMDTSNWEPVPPLAPLSGNALRSTIMINSSLGINSEDSSNSTGNNSIASSSAISSSQIPITTDDGENSVISFEGLLIPKSIKSKSSASSIIDDENSNNSLHSRSNINSQVINANQMLVDLLDKKSPDPPLHGIKRKLGDDNNTIIVSCGNDKKKLAISDGSSKVIPSKNAANLYAEMAASILEDEDLEETSQTSTSQQLQHTTTTIQQKIDNQQQKQQIISMPLQRQIIMTPNNPHHQQQQQMIIQQNPTVSGNIVTSTNTHHQATATIKTDSGLQTIPVILQKQIGPNGQQMIQPVIQHQTISQQQQQQPTQTQYVLATNPQGQTYLVAQQTPTQSHSSHQQQQQPQTLVLTQTGGQQQGGTPTKTIIILQQQGGPPQAVAQQQIISAPGQPQKMIMTTPQGQQMIVTTQIPRPIQHHQIIMNSGTSVLQTTSGGNNGNGNLQHHQNVVITQSGQVLSHHSQQQIQKQIQIHQQNQQQQQQQQQIQIQQTITPQQLSAFQQQQASILSQLPQIPATIKLHSHQPTGLPSVIQQTQTTQTQTIKMIPKQQNQPPIVSIIAQTPSQPPVAHHQQIQIQGQISKQITKATTMVPERKQIIVSGNEIIKQQTQQQQQIQQKQIQMNPQQKQQKIIQVQQQIQQPQQQIQQQQIQHQQQLPQTQQQQTQQNQIQQQQTQQSLSKTVIQQQVQQQLIQQPQNQIINNPTQQQKLVVTTSRTPTPTNILQNPAGTPTPPPQQSGIIVGRPLSTPTPPIPALNQTPPPPISPALPKPKTDEELIELNWVWICDWRGCPRRKFKSLQEVYRHACQVHCPDNLDPGAEIFCQWGPGQSLCDNIPRKRFSLMTHLLDRHCTIESLKAAVQRRLVSGLPATPGPHQPVTIIKNNSEIRGTTASPTLSTSSSSSVPSAASAAMHAIKRHTNDFLNPKELMDENEGPVTKSIRLTAALILRNLVMYTANAKRNVRFYEPHLAGVALSNVESSRTISQILYELNN